MVAEKMTEAANYVQLKRLEDLVHLVASSPSPHLLYMDIEGKPTYFVQTIAIFGPSTLYYVKTEDKIPRKYIVFNRYQDKITYSDQLGTDPQAVYIPILHVEKTNIFPATQT
ncbi:MAG: hypothetical protein QXJ75_02515 [Candidatus Bathyarchaeia archaeon]